MTYSSTFKIYNIALAIYTYNTNPSPKHGLKVNGASLGDLLK